MNTRLAAAAVDEEVFVMIAHGCQMGGPGVCEPPFPNENENEKVEESVNWFKECSVVGLSKR
jgi:hypothetical protein